MATTQEAAKSDCTSLEFPGGNRMFIVCTKDQWRAVEVFIRGLNELVEMRRTQGKSTELVGIEAEQEAINPEGRAQSSIVCWREPIGQPSLISL
jgi:hypothetical protein